MIVDWRWKSCDVGPGKFCRDHPGLHCLFELVSWVEQVELALGDNCLYLDTVVSVSGQDEDEDTVACSPITSLLKFIKGWL